MQPKRLIWLIFPTVLIVISLWVVITRASVSRLQLGIMMVLCVLGCLRQGFLLWTKGQTGYALLAFAAMIVGMAAVAVLFFNHS